MKTKATLDNVTALAKRRGFIFPGSDIYGGLANTYDLGPYGTTLKENIRNMWWKKFVESRDEIFGIDSTVLLNPVVWEASGHTDNFADIMVEDLKNRRRHRADHLLEDHFEKKGEDRKVDGMSVEDIKKLIKEEKLKSPDGNELSEPKHFNQLFETEIGIISGEKNKAYLRGEIAQGLFLNYRNIVDTMRPKMPFGIAQYGKAFRNEITQGQLLHRTLEFDLMEFEYFFDPETNNWEELFESWQKEIKDFALEIGFKDESLRWRPHEEFELSHYSKRTEDLEYDYPWGFKEMFACAYRTDFDLKNHMEKSGKDMNFRDPYTNKKFIPHVIEPTFGLSRSTGAAIFNAYDEDEINGKSRTVLRFNPKIAPVQVAVFALQKKDELVNKSREVYESIKPSYRSEFDVSSNIGKLYRRQDEIGTPICVTIDYDTLDDNSVTIRDRDTLEQERVSLDKLDQVLTKKLK